MVDIPAWVQAGAAAIGAGFVIGAAVEARVRALGKDLNDRITREVAEMNSSVAAETTARQRDVERIDKELGGLGELREVVGKLAQTMSGGFERMTGATQIIGEQVKGLADRFGDFKVASDRSTDEIKHSVRNLQVQVQTLAVAQAGQGNRRGNGGES